ncbi:response regulator [Fulvivirga sp. M361]|uniref:response regulator n=1 Tax=Fulvivirga sp. M361 TaxID=2594266 RepID=UPI001179DB4C|nr:response regulator [Fulvivirga sp. M361]TRX54888.1 response regulator [Fulvivirga sp. M361]
MKKVINVLIIDDNEIDRMIVISLIRHVFDHTNLFESKNGIEALNFLRTAQIDFPYLIFVDINMPIMNGFKFVERYEALYWQKYPQSLVYFISSSNNPEDIAKAKEFPSVTDYFIKPFDLSKAKKLWTSFFDSHKSDKANQ